MPRNVREVLRELGWVDGFHVPVANDENKRLEEKVEELIKQKAEEILKFEVANDRLNALKKHTKKLAIEKTNNQELLCALRANFDAELLTLRIVETKSNTRFQDMRKIQKNLENHQNKTQKLQDEIATYTNKMMELRETLAWEEEALFAWEEEIAKWDKNKNMILDLKYQDDDKFNELELKRQLLEVDLGNQKMTEHKEADILQNLQIELGQISKMFREVTQEQTRLLYKWHDAAKSAKNRDCQIKNCYMVVDKIRSLAREKYFELHEKRKMLTNLLMDNEKTAKEIENFQNQLRKGKTVAETFQNSIKEGIDKEKTLNRYIMNASAESNLQRSKNNEMDNTIKAVKAKIASLVNATIKLQIKIDTLNVDTLTVEQQYRNTEDIYEMGQKVLKEELRELERLQIVIFKLRDELGNLKNKQLIQEREIIGLKQHKHDLEESCNNLAVEYEELEEKLYNKELAYELLSEKYADLIGESMCTELDDRLRDEGIEIEKDIKSLKMEQNTFKFQMKILKKEVADLNIVITQGKQELFVVTDLGTNLKLFLSGGKKASQDITDEYNKKMLDLNLMKMQANLARERVNNLEEELCSLDKQKIILETAIQERKSEIQAQKDVMLVKKRGLQEEKSILKKSIEHVSMRTKQVQKRFDITMDLLGKGADGQNFTVAYFKIRLAQEKHELQEIGDELEGKINKTEKEILAMENTLRVVSVSNDQYKCNLETLDIEGPEMKEFNRLESKCHEVNEQTKLCSNDLTSVQSEIRNLKTKIILLQNNGYKMQHEWKSKEKEVEELTKDLAKKQLKLARASKILKKLMEDIKVANEPMRYKKMALRDIELRLLAEKHKNVLQQLAELSANYFDASPIVERLLESKNMSLPPVLKPITDASSLSSKSHFDTESKVSVDEVSICSISPSIVHLDPTLLLPEKYRTNHTKKDNK